MNLIVYITVPMNDITNLIFSFYSHGSFIKDTITMPFQK